MIEFFAGVVDARAHMELTNRRGRAEPRLRITTKRMHLLEWLANQTGVGVVVDERGYDRRGCSEHCSEQHIHIVQQSSYWNVNSTRACIVLFNVEPFLIEQAPVARRMLQVGLTGWKFQRGEVTQQMARLGWALPTKEDVEAITGVAA